MGSTFVLSDVHGHLADLRELLLEAGLVDGNDRWAGGDSDLWVLGDLVDRGPEGIGVIRFVRSLQSQAPEQVHVLMGNHESLMLGQKLFPGTRFSDVWAMNGGLQSDQEALRDEEVSWLRGLPLMALVGDQLLMHSDTTEYLAWGSSIEDINKTVADMLADDDAPQHFDIFAALTTRYDFLGPDGPEVARRVLSQLGGRRIVHGHSIIGSLIDVPSPHVDGPLLYADGLVVGIDGGRYDGGPLLLLRLD
ncbi:MAG TPA: metallophosphoesterase family protein [Nocardioidaceae bacterium]|nr:metallophosphoesterase family protein [Nocardioidaceae bacterium]